MITSYLHKTLDRLDSAGVRKLPLILPTNRFSVNPKAMGEPNHRARIASGFIAFYLLYVRGVPADGRSPNGNSGAETSDARLLKVIQNSIHQAD